MVSKEELEDILFNEEIEAQWNSIDQKRLDKIEEEREWYLDYTKKEYHPMSYQVKREVESWEEDLAEWYNSMEYLSKGVALTIVSFWFIVGLIVVKAILL
jgi:hypothetical protein